MATDVAEFVGAMNRVGGRIGDDGQVDFADCGLGHDGAKLGEGFLIDGRFIGGEAGRVGGVGLGSVFRKQPVQCIGAEGFKQEAVTCGNYVVGWVATADGIDGGVGAGSELGDEFGSAEAGHLRVHQDDVGNTFSRGKQIDGRTAVGRGVDGIAAHGEHGGHDFAADEVVVDEQHRRQFLPGSEVQHSFSVPPGWAVAR